MTTYSLDELLCKFWTSPSIFPQVVSWLLLPWLATVGIHPFKLREGHRGWSLTYKKWRDRKASVPENPTGPHSVSTSVICNRRVLVKVKVTQSCLTLCNPMDYTVHGILQARILEWVAVPSPGDLPNPGIEPRSPALQVNSLPAEPQGKPKNTGESSLSLLQRIFPTQESNQDLLHCRRILYQLSCNKLTKIGNHEPILM